MFYTIVGALFRTFPVLLSLGVIGRLCFTVQHTVTAIPSAYETWQNKAETLTPTLKKHEKTVGDHKNTYYCRLGYKCLIQVYSIDKRFYCRYLLRIFLKKPNILTCCDSPSPNEQYRHVVPITITYRNAACASSTGSPQLCQKKHTLI